MAQEQKNEVMSQLQTIRYLMKKRGMDCPPLNVTGGFMRCSVDFYMLSAQAEPANVISTLLITQTKYTNLMLPTLELLFKDIQQIPHVSVKKRIKDVKTASLQHKKLR